MFNYEVVKICPRCQKEFMGHKSKKWCSSCKMDVKKEQGHQSYLRNVKFKPVDNST